MVIDTLDLDETEPKPKAIDGKTNGECPQKWSKKPSHTLAHHLHWMNSCGRPSPRCREHMMLLVKSFVHPGHLMHQTMIAVEAHVMEDKPKKCHERRLPQWRGCCSIFENGLQNRPSKETQWQEPSPIDTYHLQRQLPLFRIHICRDGASVWRLLHAIRLRPWCGLNDFEEGARKAPRANHSGVGPEAIIQHRLQIPSKHGLPRSMPMLKWIKHAEP